MRKKLSFLNCAIIDELERPSETFNTQILLNHEQVRLTNSDTILCYTCGHSIYYGSIFRNIKYVVLDDYQNLATGSVSE